MNFQNRKLLTLGLTGGVIGVLAGAFALLRTQAYSTGFSGSDEPAHFLNALLISTYLQSWLGTNPLKFATDFYVHYPKITIGHWPPAYYGLVGILFLLIPATIKNAFLINLFIAALPSASVAVILGRLLGTKAAVIGAFIYSFTPLVWEAQTFIMLDQALSACCIAATMAWLGFVAKPGWARAFAFSLLFALAVLLKGNGWLLVFVPFYYILLTARYDLLSKPYLYIAALFAALLVVPWYLATAGISADGFNYKAGWSYALLAFSTNITTFISNLGIFGFVLALIAVIVEFRSRSFDPMRWSYISAWVSLLLSTLTLQSLVPADIVDRYMAPALPVILVLAIIGLTHFYKFVKENVNRFTAVAISVVFFGFMLVPGLRHLEKRGPKPDYRMAEAIDFNKGDVLPGIWLIDGTANAEGAFIAEMAIKDRPLSTYVVRASKLFAETNFMGSKYELKFATDADLLGEIKRLGIQTIVISRNGDQPAFPHSRQLIQALVQPDSGYVKKASFAYSAYQGTTDVYEARSHVVPNFEAVKKDGLPTKASKIANSMP